MTMSWIERYVSAGNPEATVECLAALASDSDYRVRARVAENIATADDVLQRLAQDAHPEVRMSLVFNPGVTMELIMQLALDDDPTVRYGLAEDVFLAPMVLHLLIADENPYVSCRAQKTVRCLSKQKGLAPVQLKRMEGGYGETHKRHRSA